MRRALATLALSGILTIGGLGNATVWAQCGYGYRGGAYATPPAYGGGGYYGGVAGPGVYGGYGGGLPGYNPNLPCSPAQQQGYREGRLYYETGLAPNHRLSPAEARGFYAGERRAAATPWQFDPIRQQGYREGQLFWETGIAPNRPLSPAEAQGFLSGERRAAFGNDRPW